MDIPPPSLRVLYNLFEDANKFDSFEQECFKDVDISTIYTYIYGKNTAALNGLLGTNNNNLNTIVDKFYLGGQEKLSIDDPISPEVMNKVDTIIKKTDLSLCWGMEIYSVMEHNNCFDNFKKIIKCYYDIMNHRMYKPGGIGYLDSKNNFESKTKGLN